jgi:DNA-binding beta-propeller fold protein YncE
LMLRSGNFVFVLNSGGYTDDSTITVISSITDQVDKTIPVYVRPTGLVEDASGKIWVMCSGKGFNGYPAAGDTRGHLLRIDPVSQGIDLDFVFDDLNFHPEKLVINRTRNIVYFLYKDGIYRFNTAIAGAQPEKVVSHARLYALAYDSVNDYLYASDPIDYQQDGWVIRFRADNGATIDSIRTGIIPGGIFFNR